MIWYRIRVMTDRHGNRLKHSVFFERYDNSPNVATLYKTEDAAKRALNSLNHLHPERTFEIVPFRVSEIGSRPKRKKDQQLGLGVKTKDLRFEIESSDPETG